MPAWFAEAIAQWRLNTRTDATLELCRRLQAESAKPRHGLSAAVLDPFADEALARSPGDLEIQIALAQTYLACGELDGAESLAHRARKATPSDERIAKILSKIRLHRGVKRGASGQIPAVGHGGLRPGFGTRPPAPRPPPAAARPLIPSDPDGLIDTHRDEPPTAAVQVDPAALLAAAAGQEQIAAGPRDAKPPSPAGAVPPRRRPHRPTALGLGSLEGQDGADQLDQSAGTKVHSYDQDELRRLVEADDDEGAAAADRRASPAEEQRAASELLPDDDNAETRVAQQVDQDLARQVASATRRAPEELLPDDDNAATNVATKAHERLRDHVASGQYRYGSLDAEEASTARNARVSLADIPTLAREQPKILSAPDSMASPDSVTGVNMPPRPQVGGTTRMQHPSPPARFPSTPPGSLNGGVDAPTNVHTQRMQPVEPPVAAGHPPPLAPPGPPTEPPPEPTGRPSPMFGDPPSALPDDDAELEAALQSSSNPAMSLPTAPEDVVQPRPGFGPPPSLDAPAAPAPDPPAAFVPAPPSASAPEPAVGRTAPEPALTSAPDAGPPLGDHGPVSRPPSRMAGVLRTIGVVLLLVSLAALGFVLYYFGFAPAMNGTGPAPDTAPDERLAKAEQALYRESLAGFPTASATMAELRAERPTDPAVVVLNARLEAVRAEALTGDAAPLKDAIAAARSAGVTDEQLLGPRLVEAALAGSDDLRDLVDHAAKLAPQDPIDQYALGAGLERLGDERALAAFQSAIGQEPAFVAAAVRLARAHVLSGKRVDAHAALERMESGPAKDLLAVLLTLNADASEGSAEVGALPATEMVPRSLASVPPLHRAASAPDEEAARKDWDDAIAACAAPAMCVAIGEIAARRDHALVAKKAADAAMALRPAYGPALRLLGRFALAEGNLEPLLAAAEDADGAVAQELKAVVAYERGRFGDLAELYGELSDDEAERPLGVTARYGRVFGEKPLSVEQLALLKNPNVLGGRLVLADAALDAGDLAGAADALSGFDKPEHHPLAALRQARLLRYRGQLNEAMDALDHALPSRPAQLERLLLESTTRDGRLHALSVLDDTLDPEGSFVRVIILSREGDGDGAKKILADLDAPSTTAPMALRRIASLAYGEVGELDPADAMIRALLVGWPKNPDVVRAAVKLELLPKDALDEL